MKWTTRLIISLLLLCSLFFGYTDNAFAHEIKSDSFTQTDRHSWGYMVYLNHKDTHKLRLTIVAGSAGFDAIGGFGGIWITGVPGKVVASVGLASSLASKYAAWYLGTKDNGKGVIFKIFKPNFYGWSPTKRYVIVGVYSR